MARNTAEIPGHIKFLFGGLGGVGATIACFPMELLKTRMQIHGAGVKSEVRMTTVKMGQIIMKSEGIMGFYSGLSASIVRQFLYTGVRIGVFQILLDHYSQDGVPPSLPIRAASGIFAGLWAGLAGLPADVCMTRMMTDASFPPDKRRNYKHVVDALARIAREEGASTLLRGWSPTVVRAAVVNLSQLLSYMQMKEIFLKNGIFDDNVYCHIFSSITSSFCATVAALPVDAAKTRMQNMRTVNGKPEYSGLVDTWTKIISKEGVVALWKGFTPMFLRNAPQYLVLFVLYEQMISSYKKHVLKSG